jgi:hypothetical protein
MVPGTLLIWIEHGKNRYFAIDSEKFGTKRSNQLYVIAGRAYYGKAAASLVDQDGDDLYDKLWWIKAAIKQDYEWAPKSVPSEWVHCLRDYEVELPSMNSEYNVVVLSISV